MIIGSEDCGGWVMKKKSDKVNGMVYLIFLILILFFE